MNQSAWRALCLTSLAIMLIISAASGVIERHIPDPVQSPAGWLVLGLLGAAVLGFVASVPPIAIRWFIATQQRIGNGAHPVIAYLAENEGNVVIVVWAMWAVGAAIAIPAALYDWMTHR